MAEVKAAVAATAKPVAKEAVAVKTAEVKTETKAAKTEVKAVKAETKAAKPGRKPGAKKATTKTTAKKAEAKATTTAKKVEVKATVNFQFDGKSYTTEDFVKIAKDVWKYDLGKKVSDFKTVDLYVKPEESQAYYVINGEVTGSFGI